MSGSRFWVGVLVGLLLSRALSGLKVDLDRVARVMYDLYAPHYDRALERFGGLEEARRLLVERLDLKSGDRVLEVCVGTGANLPYIAERIGPEGKIDGIDLSEGMLAQAREKLPSIPCEVELRWGYAEDLPYPDDSFDAVLNFGAINFITDRKKAIDEMVRVARPGARIVVGDETAAPDGPVRSLLSRLALALVPRLRPPLEMIPAGDARVTLVAGGLIYVVDWRKPGEQV
ncbi:MAG: class I SAM-dependent methyltransferase [Chloroflexota bacterium]